MAIKKMLNMKQQTFEANMFKKKKKIICRLNKV